MKKEVLGCVLDVTVKKKITFKFEDGRNREMFYILLSYVCSKEGVDQKIYDPT